MIVVKYHQFLREKNSLIGVNEIFPNFKLDGVDKDEIVQIDSTNYHGQWKVIYFYPKDFTFICPTEIIAMDSISDEVIVFGISGDNEYCKIAWKKQHQELSKIYSIELQKYQDQLVIFDRVVFANGQTKQVLMSIEKEMINRGFQINNVEESVDESRSTDS